MNIDQRIRAYGRCADYIDQGGDCMCDFWHNTGINQEDLIELQMLKPKRHELHPEQQNSFSPFWFGSLFLNGFNDEDSFQSPQNIEARLTFLAMCITLAEDVREIE